ncbi:MAG: cation transporter [Clostridia bacterium]|nr:cation transporter [Clostridia bacterium]
MTALLIKLFIKNSDDVKNPKVRTAYGVLSGAVGIAVNAIICCIKFVIGFITGSIAITADAINNLSDAGSSAVTLFGFKISNKPADKEHPFGHGRVEYITSLIVSFIVLFMSFELAVSSVEKITDPQPVKYSFVSAIILGVSILGKVWLALFNRKLGKKIDSSAMTAVVKDSIGDIAATTATLIALVVSKYSDIPIDGYLGVFVSLFVFWAGFSILREATGTLLGKPPTKEFVDELEKEILSYEGVMGIHDLMLHDYGPGRIFGSVHVEVSGEVDINISHDLIDNIEKDILEKFGLLLVIHMDPLEVNAEKVNNLKETILTIVKEINPEYTIHDFRIVESPSHTNLIFDLVIPYGHKQSRQEIADLVSENVKKHNPMYCCVVTVEHSFV